MNLDLSKPVKFKSPLRGEEDLQFKVKSYNEVTNRCYIELICDLAIKPQELVDVNKLINV